MGEEQLRLIGKLAWLKTDERVEGVSLKYIQIRDSYLISIRFKNMLPEKEFEGLLEKYEIQNKYSRNSSVRHINPLGIEGIEVAFSPVEEPRNIYK